MSLPVTSGVRFFGVLALGILASFAHAELTAQGIPLPTPSQSPPPLTHAVSPFYYIPTDDPFFPVTFSDLPGPSVYRDASGKPGPQYWQQRADYNIQVAVDTARGTVDGRLTIKYTNNSPQALEFVWIQLDQNRFRANSDGDNLGGYSIFHSIGGGIDLSDVTANGEAVTPEIHGTMARLDLARAIPANGGMATIAMKFTYVVSRGALRMGRDSTLYLMGQWYPRMAVYDDVRGWNTEQYLGVGEFYLEYGDFDYAVTVPAGYTVTGTGVLTNAAQVLTSAQRARLAVAAKDTGVVAIVTAGEALTSRTRLVPGTKTWRFSAKNVRDVAWAASPDFRWDATSWHGILCQALYNHRARKDWEHTAEQTCWAIAHYSKLMGLYPYPVAISVAGTVMGMEYPMITFDAYGGHGSDSPEGNFPVIDHEMGHQWFPMVVGNNERRYMWLDEGLNSYMNVFAVKRRGLHLGQATGERDANVLLERLADATVMMMADHGGNGFVAYYKPAALLFALRNQIVGRATFDRAFRAYYERWKFKHPTPADFFRTIENVSGQDLSWFWRGFFYSNDVLDIGIDTVYQEPATAEERSHASDLPVISVIRVSRKTSIPFPLSLRVKFNDGTTRDLALPVDALVQPSRTIRVIGLSPIVGVRLWPHQGIFPSDTTEGRTRVLRIGSVPDANPVNDVWGDAPASTPPTELPIDGGLPLLVYPGTSKARH